MAPGQNRHTSKTCRSAGWSGDCWVRPRGATCGVAGGRAGGGGGQHGLLPGPGRHLGTGAAGADLPRAEGGAHPGVPGPRHPGGPAVSARVLVVEHEKGTHAGYVGERLLASGLELDVRRPYLDEPLPRDLAEHDALLVLGGSPNPYDETATPWLVP